MTHKLIADELSALEREALALTDAASLDPAPYVPDYRGIAAYICIWTPPELLRAGGLHPVLMRGESASASPGSCATCAAFAGGWLESILDRTRLIVVAETCTGIVRLLSRVAREREIPLFSISEPENLTDDGLRAYVHQLSWLRDTVRGDMPLERYEANLAGAFSLYSAERSLLAALRADGRIPDRTVALLQAAAQTAPPESVIPLVERAFELARELPPSDAVPLLLIGGMMERDRFALYDALAAAGGRIAADLLCSSGRGPHRSAPGPGLSLFDRIAFEHFNQLPCLPVEPNRRFYIEAKALVEREGIKGILYYEPRGCGPYRRERERFHWNAPVPVMYIDSGFLAREPDEMVSDFADFLSSL